MTLGDKILYCRKRLGLSQEALAYRLGVSRQAVSKWETGEAVPELGKLALLAKTFGVTADWLLSDEEPQQERMENENAQQEPHQNAYPSWMEHLPDSIRRIIKRYGWLYGVYLAIGGALIAGIGLIGRYMSKQMFSGFDQEVFFAEQYGATVNSPVYTMCGFIIGLGVLLMTVGILPAIILKRCGNKGN